MGAMSGKKADDPASWKRDEEPGRQQVFRVRPRGCKEGRRRTPKLLTRSPSPGFLRCGMCGVQPGGDFPRMLHSWAGGQARVSVCCAVSGGAGGVDAWFAPDSLRSTGPGDSPALRWTAPGGASSRKSAAVAWGLHVGLTGDRTHKRFRLRGCRRPRWTCATLARVPGASAATCRHAPGHILRP